MTYVVMPECSHLAVETPYTHRFYAMASPFTFHLVGDNPTFLGQVGRAMEKIVRQIEHLLSRYNAASELWRINHEAASHPVQCSVEMFELLSQSLWAYEFTNGYFDIGWERENKSISPLTDCLLLTFETRSVSFLDTQLKLDFGGLGKGYALDQVVRELARWGLDNYLLNAGNSSVIARGEKSEKAKWSLLYQDTEEKFELCNQAFSCSANEKNSVFVFGPDGFSTEIISTALIGMNENQAAHFYNSLGDTYDIH